MLEQLFHLQENGIKLELLMALPPKTVDFAWDEECADTEMDVGNANIKITRTPLGSNAAYPHEARVTGVEMKLCINITFDGGTWGAAAGTKASIRAEQNSFLDNMDREEHQKPLRHVKLRRGENLRKKCEELKPGNEAFFRLNCMANQMTESVALNKLTRRLDRVVRMNDVTPATAGTAATAGRAYTFRGDTEQREQEAEARAQVQRAALRQRGADVGTEYADEDLNDMGFDPDAYYAATRVDGTAEQGYGITEDVDELTIVRMVCLSTPRILENPAWGNLPVQDYAAICILHNAMRCGEHLFESILASLRNDYEAGTQAAVDKHLNTCLAKMGIRRIAVNRETG